MSLPEDLKVRGLRRLSEFEQAGLMRRPRPPAGIDLCSNDYLGLASHPRLKRRMAAALESVGVGSTGSRLLRGERAAFAQLERRFAQFKGAEAALYFGSGYAANLGVLSTFLETGDVVFSDELNHASLIDGMRLGRARRLVFPHCDLDALRRALDAETGGGQRFLVTESLFSMNGDRAPLPEYASLCRDTNTALIVDEAHAVGIYGACGSGLIEAEGVGPDVFLSINAAGKALGVAGAFVAGPEWAIDCLVHQARSFVFSTAPPPSIAAALEAALDLIAEEPERRETLLQRARTLRAVLRENGIAVGGDAQIMPIMLGDNCRALSVASALQDRGFDVRAVRPPTVPPGTARLRVCVNVNLDEPTLRRFALAAMAALGGNA